MNLFIFVMFFLMSLSLISAEISDDISYKTSIQQYREQYPVFNKENALEEAPKIAQNKFFPISLGTEVEIKTNRGSVVKGKYLGLNLGDLVIGNRKISWIDVPEEKKYLFSEYECKKLREEFIENYLRESREQYLKKRLQDIAAFEHASWKALKAKLIEKKGIELSNGNILYFVEIIKKSFDGISIKHNDSIIDLKYNQISSLSRGSINSDFEFKTLDNCFYRNVKVIETSISTVKFYNSQDEMEEINFSRLPKDIQDKLGYSAEAEAEYKRQVREEAIRIREEAIRNAAIQEAKSYVSYNDILIFPRKYLERDVTMKGEFSFKYTERKSFDMTQGDNRIEVFYDKLPRDVQVAIINKNNFSNITVIAKGILKRYADANNTYYIMASSVTFR